MIYDQHFAMHFASLKTGSLKYDLLNMSMEFAKPFRIHPFLVLPNYLAFNEVIDQLLTKIHTMAYTFAYIFTYK